MANSRLFNNNRDKIHGLLFAADDVRPLPRIYIPEYDVKYHLNKLYKIVERPFPIRRIAIIAKSDGSVECRLDLRTHVDFHLIKHTASMIKTADFFSCPYKEHIGWFLNLNKHGRAEIEDILNNIFKQLACLTNNEKINDRIKFIYNEIQNLLAAYLDYFPAPLPPEYNSGINAMTNHRLNPVYNYLFNELAQGNEEESRKLISDCSQLYNAVTQGNIEETHRLLANGINPDIWHHGQTMLTSAIYWNERNKVNLATKLSIITLLLEYGANPMQESSYGKNSFEITIGKSLFFENKFPAEYFADILNLLAAGDPCHTGSMGMIVHGSNMFYKEMNAPILRIIGLDRDEHTLHIYLNDKKIINVNILTGADFKDENDWKDIFKLCKLNFPWEKHYKNENEFKEYLKAIIQNPASIIETVYLDHVLVGINIAETLKINEEEKNYLVHFAKLTVADAKFCEQCKGLMSNLAIARGFALQAEFPETPVMTYLEIASIFSYAQAKDVSSPRVQDAEVDRIIEILASKLYDKDKVVRSKNIRHIEDPLAVARKFNKPDSIWSKRDVSGKVYNDYYQKDKHSLLMGFFNTKENLKKLEKKLRMNGCDISLSDVIRLYINKQHPCASFKSKL